MKYFFHTILLVASLGTIAAIVNPPLVQQGAALIGLKLPQNTSDPAEEISSENQLAKFLEQYPSFTNSPNNAIVPAPNVPMVVLPAPAPPPIPAVYGAPVPATPFPTPAPEPVVPEPVAPAYAHSWDNTNWDGAAATPIYASPAIEYHPPTDWSGPSQPYWEPTSVSQQSVYTPAPPEDIITAAPPVIQEVPGFAQTRYVPPPTPPPYQSPQPTPPPPNATLQTPAILVEDVPVPGTETVARVGRQVILMGDILPKLRRVALKMVAENFKQMSEEERTKVSQQEIEQVMNVFVEKQYPEFLQEQIIFALVYNDYDLSQDRASKNMLSERMGEEFDRVEVPEMLKEFKVENIAALKRFLAEQLGSSLEKERRFWVQEQIVRQWIGMSIQRATAECTQDEMMDFYERNQAMFTSEAKARWQEMLVLFSQHSTEQEAWKKIQWMGNQVIGGAPFEEIAKANSDGFTASDGGVRDWTTKGSLTSAELEQAIFSQPIGQLSPAIIRSNQGLHIVRVLERQETKVVPFVEAQAKIRERIKNQRTQRYQDEYLADLRNRIPIVIVKDRIDFNINSPRTASSEW